MSTKTHRQSAQIVPVTMFEVEGLGAYPTEAAAFEALEQRAEKQLRLVFQTLAQPVHPGDQIRWIRWALENRQALAQILNF